MNENNEIDNPPIKIVKCVSAKAQDEKYVESTQNHTIGVMFNVQNSQFLT